MGSATEVFGNALWWLATPFAIIVLVWGWVNYKTLNGRETHPDSFQQAIGWLREDNFSELYLTTLGWLLDKISDLMGDAYKFDQIYVTSANPKGLIRKTFGFNPFTSESYGSYLWLTHLYPVTAFLIAWAAGSNGQVGGVDWLKLGAGRLDLELWQRWLVIAGLVLAVGGSLWLVSRWAGWRQWLVLNAPFLILAVVAAAFSERNGANNLIKVFVIGWGIFLLAFIPSLLGRWVAGLLVYRFVRQAQEALNRVNRAIFTVAAAFAIVSTFAFAFAFAFAVTSTVDDTFLAATYFAFAIGGAVAVGMTVAMVGVSVVTFALAFSFAFAIAGLGAGISPAVGITAVAASVAGAGAIIVVLDTLQYWSEQQNKAGWFWLLYSVVFFVVGYYLLSLTKESGDIVFLLFWVLLPLVSVPLDWVALGMTRGLLQAVRAGQHSGRLAFDWAMVDLLLALVFLFLNTAVLVGVTALGNTIAGDTLVNIGGILGEMKAKTADSNHWWIYFMLLFTLTPTLVHFALAGGAIALWLPRKTRLWLADGLERNHYKTFMAWAYLTFTPVIGFVLAPAGLLSGLWWLVNANGGWLGSHLLAWAEMLTNLASLPPQ